MSAAPPGDRVSASVFVEAPPEVAFEVFTAQIDLWWRHGLRFRAGGRRPSVLHLEPRLGGRLFETVAADEPGAEAHVVHSGTIVDWDPPRSLRLEWRGVNFAPGEKTTLAVSFAARAAGTLVTLVHSGFASLPPDHPVRHGQPTEVFVRRMGLWWGEQMSSLRDHVARGRPEDAS